MESRNEFFMTFQKTTFEWFAKRAFIVVVACTAMFMGHPAAATPGYYSGNASQPRIEPLSFSSQYKAEQEKQLLEFPAVRMDIDQKEYIVGSGDTLNIRIWEPGSESTMYQMTVTQGNIFLEMIGEVEVAGLSLEKAIDIITRKYTENFPNFKVHVALYSMRVFEVLVTGQVKFPGYYRVNPVTRLSDLLQLAGGTTSIGSSRNLKVSYKDGSSQTCDLFSFREEGDTGQNPLIRRGASVFVPVRYGFVEVKGDVLRPGKFEILEGEDLSSLISFFKGIAPDAYRGRIVLKRASTSSGTVHEGRYILKRFNWDEISGESGKDFPLQDGDILDVRSIKQFVIVQGLVVRPGEYIFTEGMRLLDLLNDAGGLGIVGKGDVGEPGGGTLEETTTTAASKTINISGDYNAMLKRVGRQKGEIEYMEIDLTGLLFGGDESQNVELLPGDVITITAQLDSVYVHGMVREAGFFPYNSANTVRDYIFLAGGPTPNGEIGRTKLTTGGDTFHVDLNRVPKTGDIIYIPQSEQYTYRTNMSFLSNLATFYLMIDNIMDD